MCVTTHSFFQFSQEVCLLCLRAAFPAISRYSYCENGHKRNHKGKSVHNQRPLDADDKKEWCGQKGTNNLDDATRGLFHGAGMCSLLFRENLAQDGKACGGEELSADASGENHPVD